MMVLCAGCEKPIFDRYLHHVIDKPWHAACVTCNDCKSPLKDKCFSREGRLYCRTDFLKRYGTKCAGCQRVIQMTDLVRRAREKVFHVACFRCMTCQKQLDTGEELYIINGCKFLCKSDYLNPRHSYGTSNSCLSECGSEDGDDDDLLMADDGSLLSAHGVGKGGNEERTADSTAPASHLSSRSTDHSPSSPESMSSSQQQSSQRDQSKHNSSSGADENNGGSGGGNGPQQQGGAKRRGPRTTIKAKQLETLKAAFAATPKPTRHIREQLAQETGLNMRVIQVWFQNRRSKERRMKQLRYGSFRPGSRRSRNLLRDDPGALMAGAGAIFADGLRRHPDAYYPHPSYYCDMFPMGPEHPGESPSGMGMAPPGAFMMGHPDDGVVPMEGHGPDGPFLMDDPTMRRGVSPDRGLPPTGGPGGGEDFRAHHGFTSALLPTNEGGMANW